MIQLDTSFLIRALASGSAEDRQLRRWLKDRESLAVSAIAWTEFQCGPVSPTTAELARRLLGEPIAFTAMSSEMAASLFNGTGRRRGSLVDCMVAAVALEAGDGLATSNPQDFRRFEPMGLVLHG